MYRYRISEWSEEGAGSLSRWDRFYEWSNEWSTVASTFYVSWLLVAIWFLIEGRDLSLFVLYIATYATYLPISRLIGKHRNTASERLGRLKRFFDLPAAVPQFPLRVIYRKGLFVFGRDVGVVTLLNGCVSFEGEHSRFTVPQNVDSWCSWAPSFESFPKCRIHTGGGALSIEFQFIKSIYGGEYGKYGSAKNLKFSRLDCGGIQRWDSLPPIPGTEFLLPRLVTSRLEFRRLRWQLYHSFLCVLCPLVLLLVAHRVGGIRTWHQAEIVASIFAIIALISFGSWLLRWVGLIRMSKETFVEQAQTVVPQMSISEAEQHAELNQAG